MGAGHRVKPDWLLSAERQGLVSAMNATKWREVATAMHALPGGSPSWVAKDIDREGPSGRDRDWVYHLRPFETVEWVDIPCGEGSRANEVLAALSAVGVRGVRTADGVRVYGWLRPGESGTWLSAAPDPASG